MLRASRGMTLLVLVTAVAVGCGLYLLVARQAGFPLDDAWIHQTYARNLARDGRWAFVPGVASAGSTAPLWTLLLAVGYALGVPYLAWTWLLGALCLIWLAWMTLRLWQLLWPQQAAWGWAAGLTVALLWPLLWAALSGMETLLFTALVLTLLVVCLAGGATSSRRVALLGLVAGLLIATRPDGVWPALLVGLAVLLQPGPARLRLRHVGVLGATAVLVLLPYFAFNWRVSGRLWPNTLYAKQVEYAVLLARPWLLRLINLLWFSLGGPPQGWRGISGAQLILLPGVLAAAWQAVRLDWQGRRLWRLLPLVWALGHVALFAWRLPVTYQHGRYLLPVLPVWVAYGLAGWQMLLAGDGRGHPQARWIARRVVALTLVVLLVTFVGLGARAYAIDVAFVEGEMVTAARWVAANTATDAVIAAHDVGALGYFAPRRLVDLGGLTDPELLPDETAVAWAIGAADYLVTAPGWPYTAAVLAANAELVFATDFAWTRAQGSNNVQVFRLPARPLE